MDGSDVLGADTSATFAFFFVIFVPSSTSGHWKDSSVTPSIHTDSRNWDRELHIEYRVVQEWLGRRTAYINTTIAITINSDSDTW